MKIRLSHGIIAATLGLFFARCDHLKATYQATQDQGAIAQQSRIKDSADRDAARNLAKRSTVALERVKAGCLPVATNGIEDPLSEGQQVATGGAGSPLQHGVFVCNSRGETAAVATVEGISTLEAIATASPQDLDEYRQHFAKITNPQENHDNADQQ